MSLRQAEQLGISMTVNMQGHGRVIPSFFIRVHNELLGVIKRIVPEYEDWMVNVNYEIEKKRATLPGFGSRS